MSHPTDIPALLNSWLRRFEDQLDRTLPSADREPRRLHAAMRYSAQSGGKRIRPMLVCAAGHALDVAPEWLDPLCCAVELVHAYSLIHDDLPAMDDDALRRGRPTCHLAFDEATAILAGDALQALAFETLASGASIPDRLRIRLISDLAGACGSDGMAGGQALDLAATGGRLQVSELEDIHRSKTGALIRVAVTGVATLAEANAVVRVHLERFGDCVGLGFQIRDDILDVTGDSRLTGKPSQADAARNQPTFPALIGLDGSTERALALRNEALTALAAIPGDTTPLAWLADYMIQRNR